MKRILLLVVAVHLTVLAPSLARAQSRPARHETTKGAAPTQQITNIHDTFGLATPEERWSLDDALPNGAVDFAGKKLSLDDRKVNVSTNPDGERQLLYPVSWYEPYKGQNPDLKYVVVKYRDGKARQIMAEYLPNRVSMPKASFQPHPDGKSFYSDVSTVRQEGQLYFKQAISQGREDGKGGLWVDMVVMYSMEDTPAPKPTASRRP